MMLMRSATTLPIGTSRPSFRGDQTAGLKSIMTRNLYRQHNRIERMFGQLKINCSIATRYDQLAASFLRMVHIASAAVCRLSCASRGKRVTACLGAAQHLAARH